jgi:rubrerythrin
MLIRGILLSITLFTVAVVAADGPNLATVEHLQAAHRAEMNAEARYLAFATKADEEGYKQVASLFRAVARAEQILYTYHFDAIKELGAVPEDVVTGEVTVASTKDNLEKSSDKAAGDQLDSEYTGYAKAARGEGNRTAAKVFDYARLVEAQNFRLFAGAAKNMDHMRGNPSGYFICGLTGFVSVTMDPANCGSPDWERVR